MTLLTSPTTITLDPQRHADDGDAGDSDGSDGDAVDDDKLPPADKEGETADDNQSPEVKAALAKARADYERQLEEERKKIASAQLGKALRASAKAAGFTDQEIAQYNSISKLKSAISERVSGKVGAPKPKGDDTPGETSDPAIQRELEQLRNEREQLIQERNTAKVQASAREAYLTNGGRPNDKTQKTVEAKAIKLMIDDLGIHVDDDGDIVTKEGLEIEKAVKVWLHENPLFKKPSNDTRGAGAGQAPGANAGATAGNPGGAVKAFYQRRVGGGRRK